MTGNTNTALVEALRTQGLTIAVAESLTGGGLCSRIVDVPGASDVLRGGVCTYATGTKHRILNVPLELLDAHGAVHPDVASSMARGVAALYETDVALATTGVAGPGPADGHPAGTVYIACTVGEDTHVRGYHFQGDRPQIRTQAIDAAIALAYNLVKRA